VFRAACSNAPSIVFIDEVDALGSKREESRDALQKRLVACLLTLMDGIVASDKVR